jgi:hypothetical protein
MANVLKTATSGDFPLDGSTGDTKKPGVSDFLTIQSLANFSAMAGALSVAWSGLKTLSPKWFSAIWVPYVGALLWALVSFLISLDGLKKEQKHQVGIIAGAILIALINAIVLGSAVVGVGPSTGK